MDQNFHEGQLLLYPAMIHCSCHRQAKSFGPRQKKQNAMTDTKSKDDRAFLGILSIRVIRLPTLDRTNNTKMTIIALLVPLANMRGRGEERWKDRNGIMRQ